MLSQEVEEEVKENSNMVNSQACKNRVFIACLFPLVFQLPKSSDMFPSLHFNSPSMNSIRTATTSTLRSVSSRRQVISRSAKTSAAPSTEAESSDPPYELPDIRLGPTHSSRYQEHYHNALASDLMYMSYNHRVARTPPPPIPQPQPMTPYEANRPSPMRNIKPRAKPITPDTIPQLESIIIHTMSKEAISNKNNLLTTIMALRAMSGESAGGGGRTGSKGVQVIKAKTGAAQWRLREGMPIACKVELRGQPMYDFLQTLVDFVLPRIRDYPGLPIPNAGTSMVTPSAISGVVSFGLPPMAMSLFPQIEANIEAYPRISGFHMHFLTNQKGPNSDSTARTLLSGFRIPFYRR